MKAKKNKVKPKESKASPTKRPRFWYFPLLVFLLALVQYSNTLTHDYAWDDELVITKNAATQKGIAGLGTIWTKPSFITQRDIYRPIPQSLFAIEKQFFGNNPAVGHGFSILYYALCVLLLFLVLKKLFRKTHPVILLAITALFAVHPIHTEVVANIKSRDEILALLFGLGSIFFFIKYLDYSKIKYLLLAIIMLGLGCLSKLNAITILGFFPVLYFYRKMEKAPWIKTSFLKTFFGTKASEQSLPETSGFFGKTKISWSKTSNTRKTIFWLCPIILLLISFLLNMGLLAFAALLFPTIFLIFFEQKMGTGEAIWANILIAFVALFFGWKSVAMFAMAYFLFKIAANHHATFNPKDWWPTLIPTIAVMGTHGLISGLSVTAFLVVLTALLWKRQWLISLGIIAAFLAALIFTKENYHFNMLVYAGMLLTVLLLWKDKARYAYLPLLVLMPLSVLPFLLLHIDQINTHVYSEKNGNTEQLPADTKTLSGKELPYDIINNTLITASGAREKYATIADVQLRYLAKLFYPHPLVHQYGYNSIPLTNFDDPKVGISIFLHFVLILLCFYFLLRGNPIGLGIAFYFITISIYTNIVVLVPDTMAERFLFIPSVGFCVALIFALKEILKPRFDTAIFSGASNVSFLAISLVLLIAFLGETMMRNKDWKDPVTLITNTLPHAPENAALHAIYAAEWNKYLQANPASKNAAEIRSKIIAAQEKAIKIYPRYFNAIMDLGSSYMQQSRLEDSKRLFKQAREVNDAHPLSHLYLGFIALQERRNEDCIKLISTALEKNEKCLEAYRLVNFNYKQALIFLGRAYAFTGQMSRAKVTLETGNNKFAGDGDFMKILGGLQEQQGDLNGAMESYQKGLTIDKNNKDLREGLNRLKARITQ